MVDKYELAKRMVIVVYVLLVSGILFAMSQTDMSSPNEMAFFRFASFFWGGSFAFHYLSALLPLPANERNWGQWKTLRRRLLIAAATIVTTIALMYAAARLVMWLEISLAIYALVALAVFGVGLWLSFGHAGKFHAELEFLKTG